MFNFSYDGSPYDAGGKESIQGGGLSACRTFATHNLRSLPEDQSDRSRSSNSSPSRNDCEFVEGFYQIGSFHQSLSSDSFESQALHVHLPNQAFRVVRLEDAPDVRQIINGIVGSMSHGQKTNSHRYGLRLRHVLTKETQWMRLDMPTSQVIAHMWNPSCCNAECAKSDRFPAQERFQRPPNNVVGHSNSVWKADLRIRYSPKDLKTFYETERTACHFYFDQVSCISRR